MSLVPARCPQCSGTLEVDPSLDAAICSYCNTPYIVQKAINNYNTTHVTNIETLNADTVNFGDNELENSIKAGEAYIKLCRYDQAEDIFFDLVDRYPHDYRSWWGLIRVKSCNFTDYDLSRTDYEYICDLYDSMKQIGDPQVIANHTSMYLSYIAKAETALLQQESLNQTALERVTKELEQIKKAEENKITALDASFESSTTDIKANIAYYDSKIEAVESIEVWIACILGGIVLLLVIALLANSSGTGNFLFFLIMGPLFLGGLAWLIHIIIKIIVIFPIVSIIQSKKEKWDKELQMRQDLYNEASSKIKEEYASKQNKLLSECADIRRTIELYS